MSNIHVTDYWKMKKLVREDFSFNAALAYLIHKADPSNKQKLVRIWPNEVAEMQQRYDAPGGAITEEEKTLAQKVIDEGRLNVLEGEVDP